MSSTGSLATVALFVVYVLTSCGGLYLIKAAPSWTSATFAAGFGLYAAGAVLWMVMLRLMALSFAFPIAAGALVCGTMLTGALFLAETITVPQLVGAGMIVAGIALVATNR